MPISPVMRDDTVAKKKPKTTIRTATRMLPCSRHPGVDGEEQRQQQRSDQHHRHRDVAFGARCDRAAAPAPKPLQPFERRRRRSSESCGRA